MTKLIYRNFPSIDIKISKSFLPKWIVMYYAISEKKNLNRCVFLGLSYYQIDERNRLIQQHKNLDLLWGYLNYLLLKYQARIQTIATLKNFVSEKSGKHCQNWGKYWIKSGNQEILRIFIFFLYPRLSMII